MNNAKDDRDKADAEDDGEEEEGESGAPDNRPEAVPVAELRGTPVVQPTACGLLLSTSESYSAEGQ